MKGLHLKSLSKKQIEERNKRKKNSKKSRLGLSVPKGTYVVESNPNAEPVWKPMSNPRYPDFLKSTLGLMSNRFTPPNMRKYINVDRNIIIAERRPVNEKPEISEISEIS